MAHKTPGQTPSRCLTFFFGHAFATLDHPERGPAPRVTRGAGLSVLVSPDSGPRAQTWPERCVLAAIQPCRLRYRTCRCLARHSEACAGRISFSRAHALGTTPHSRGV